MKTKVASITKEGGLKVSQGANRTQNSSHTLSSKVTLVTLIKSSSRIELPVSC